MNISFITAPSVFSNYSTRIIYTPSTFARSSLLHLQETGTLQALFPHKNERSGLASYLFFTVLDGVGRLSYGGREYKLGVGDCVFIDCKKKYSHETPLMQASHTPQNQIHVQSAQNHINHTGCVDDMGVNVNANGGADDTNGGRKDETLWSLQWCHFYGPNMNAIYRKYQERGGQPVFRSEQLHSYHKILTELYEIAASDDYVRDMKIHEKLSSLLILFMEDAWTCRDINGKTSRESADKTVDIQSVKDYLDQNFKSRITLDGLSSRFYINKYYLMSYFKEHYGVTINTYLNQVRVTFIKQNLRFTEKTVEMLAAELDIEPTYLSRLFKKIEGITPSEYRKQWSSNQNKDET